MEYLGNLILHQCTIVSNQAPYCSGVVAQGGTTLLHGTLLANGNQDLWAVTLGDVFRAEKFRSP